MSQEILGILAPNVCTNTHKVRCSFVLFFGGKDANEKVKRMRRFATRLSVVFLYLRVTREAHTTSVSLISAKLSSKFYLTYVLNTIMKGIKSPEQIIEYM